MVIIYDKFLKSTDRHKFAEGLRGLVSQCREVGIGKVYTINSKDAGYLAEIARRVRG